MFEQARTLDPVGNISTATTTVPAGTDSQTFCYDDQNRLTWAGSSGTPPCTGTAISGTTLSGAQYSQSFGYDDMGRLTSGPQGTYTYGTRRRGAIRAGTGCTSVTVRHAIFAAAITAGTT
jgi:hypothetical protein